MKQPQGQNSVGALKVTELSLGREEAWQDGEDTWPKAGDQTHQLEEQPPTQKPFVGWYYHCHHSCPHQDADTSYWYGVATHRERMLVEGLLQQVGRPPPMHVVEMDPPPMCEVEENQRQLVESLSRGHSLCRRHDDVDTMHIWGGTNTTG
jgi:hypothetical protein